MTGPAIVAPSAPESFGSVDEGINAITAQAVAESIASSEPETPAPTRDEKGRFLPKEPSEPVESTPTAESETAQIVADASAPPAEVPETPAPVVLPEGFVAVPKVEGRELATSFTLHDKDGEIEIPDVTIKFNANGKERTESLDKVVKLAQFGVYNHEREQQVQQSKQETQAAQARVQQVEQYARQLEADRQRLLSDDAHYLTSRAEHDAQNTPEARLAQREQQLVQQQQHAEFTQASQSGQQFFASELAPSVDQITHALPTVSPEEIGAKLLLVSNQHMVHTPFGSIIPPRAYPAIRQALLTDVLPWAQQLHEHRDGERKTTTTKTDAEKLALQKAADQARAESQKAKTLIGKAGASSAGRVAPNTTPPKPIRTVDDAMDSALADTLASMR